MVRKPVKPGCRLCPARLSETPAVLSMYISSKGYHISHGWRQRLKKSVITETFDKDLETEDVKDHAKQALEHVKEEQDVDDDDELPAEEPVLGGAKEKKEDDDDDVSTSNKKEWKRVKRMRWMSSLMNKRKKPRRRKLLIMRKWTLES